VIIVTGQVMSYLSSRRTCGLDLVFSAAAISAILASPAAAQQQLPGIVVQGSSVAVSPPRKPQPDEAPAEPSGSAT